MRSGHEGVLRTQLPTTTARGAVRGGGGLRQTLPLHADAFVRFLLEVAAPVGGYDLRDAHGPCPFGHHAMVLQDAGVQRSEEHLHHSAVHHLPAGAASFCAVLPGVQDLLALLRVQRVPTGLLQQSLGRSAEDGLLRVALPRCSQLCALQLPPDRLGVLPQSGQVHGCHPPFGVCRPMGFWRILCVHDRAFPGSVRQSEWHGLVLLHAHRAHLHGKLHQPRASELEGKGVRVWHRYLLSHPFRFALFLRLGAHLPHLR